MFLKKIRLKNFLSYGPDADGVELRDLNIIAGPNGSGKSNLFEALSLLRSAPRALVAPIRKGGGAADWLWKGSREPPVASLSFDFGDIFPESAPDAGITYTLDFTVVRGRFEIVREEIAGTARSGGEGPRLFYSHEGRSSAILTGAGRKRLEREDIDPEASIFAQRKDPDHYPEITRLGKMLEKIRIYREWRFGIDCALRQSQPTDGEASCLLEDCGNLALVLNTLLTDLDVREKLQREVKKMYDGADEAMVRIEAGRALALVSEKGMARPIPANRLSDGTLRYLCLTAILLNPEASPLICLDEPELGLHPDLTNSLAGLLEEASGRTQLIVTTHSPLLLDAFSGSPENVMICEKRNGRSALARIDGPGTAPLPERRSLGDLWMRGLLGGTRW